MELVSSPRVLEHLIQLMRVSAVACSACSAQSWGAMFGEDAAVFGEDSNEAEMVHSEAPQRSRAELPRSVGSPLWLQSYDAGEITSVASDSTGSVVLARAGTGLMKLSGAGALLWSKPFGSQVAVDVQDSVYVAGTFTGKLAVDDRALETVDTEAFLVKLDADGNVAYARALGQAADGAISSLAADGGGRVAVSGPGFGTVKLDESGSTLWRKVFAGKVRFDSAGNLLLAGELVGTLDFGARVLASQGGSDVLLLKLGPEGTPIFAHSYGDAGALQRADAIAVDAEDNVVIAGTFDGRVDFGVGALELTPAQCSSDAWCVSDGFAAKLDTQGRAVWSVAFGPMREVSGIAIDQNGDTVLSGALPGGVRPFRQTWLAKLDANGAEVWHRSEWPDTGIGAGHSVAVDRHSQVFWSLSARPSLELEEQFYLAKLTP